MERLQSEVDVPLPMSGIGSRRLVHGVLGSSESDLDLQNSGSAQKRKKKKCRKHQRFLDHRALLRQRRLLNPRVETQNHLGRSDPTGASKSFVFIDNKDPVENRYCIKSANSTPEKERGKLNMLKEVLSCSLPRVQHIPLNSQGDDSGLSTMPSSSTSSRPSSPCSWQNPVKCVAIDCEMVGTGPGGKISELARCSVVSYSSDVIYDKYIKPMRPIVDYRTRWSGITERHMRDAVPFQVAQKEIRKILKGKMVVGHALHHDFHVLKYSHPRAKTRDTSRAPWLNQKAGLPSKATTSLKVLAWQLLHRRIQVGKAGHSSVEDALTSLDLYKLVEVEWEQDVVSTFLSSSSSTFPGDSCSDSDHYMEDRYWPEDLSEDCK
ncbi:apoptosis-enhancing nuclease isoform X2 [Microcaecilia unicolor]|uniref:Exonuclease XPMC2 n=1 Tax=Microcaecilia unicolor TaxID=1415580 RepID=A0A6P7WZA3_9AMPH|nr:apoptosis-enhancing nuclease isoform X1 [Microcaecilia unicolor]XP_030045564.1 apoptosis-enhancing nuclease isoform X2 [Microcaecilia unicolor]